MSIRIMMVGLITMVSLSISSKTSGRSTIRTIPYTATFRSIPYTAIFRSIPYTAIFTNHIYVIFSVHKLANVCTEFGL